MPPSPQQAQAIDRTTAVEKAAAKYGIPSWVLDGVFAKETDRGANIATSSAGAIGAFQFMPATARHYAYPLTNQPNAAQFQQQADAAAHYLSDLHKQHGGDWDAAIHAYSGGGYGLDEVKAKGQAKGQAAVAAVGDKLSGAASALGDAAAIPGKFLGLITNPQTWLRLVEIVMGVALLLMGLRSFTGGAVDPVGLAARTARTVA